MAERLVLLDRFEPESLRTRRGFRKQAFDAGYLVTPSFSPSVSAAKLLRVRGRPYVVDTGDPWKDGGPVGEGGLPAAARRGRAERDLLGGSAGIVVTTEAQAEEVRIRFPGIPLLVRANGFQEVPVRDLRGAAGGDPKVLKLVHFGRVDRKVRLDPVPFLVSLAESGRWDRVVLTQVGPDPRELSNPGRADVVIETRDLVPWPDAVDEASRHDVALVIGNLPGREMQLPSKAIEYLGLPIPRVALCSGPNDSLFRYTDGLPGYLSVVAGNEDAVNRTIRHLDREWKPEELEPPDGESWDRVSGEIADFVDSCLRRVLAVAEEESAAEELAPT